MKCFNNYFYIKIKVNKKLWCKYIGVLDCYLTQVSLVFLLTIFVFNQQYSGDSQNPTGGDGSREDDHMSSILTFQIQNNGNLHMIKDGIQPFE